MSAKLGGQRVQVRPMAVAAAAMMVMVAAGAAAADVVGVVKARQAHYKEIGKATKAISEQLKSATPSVPVIQAAAKQIDALAPQVESWFPAGSGPAAGVKTQAKPEIWTRGGEFKHDAATFADAAHKLNLAAATGNLMAIRAQFQATGQTCKACHETFRQRDD